MVSGGKHEKSCSKCMEEQGAPINGIINILLQ